MGRVWGEIDRNAKMLVLVVGGMHVVAVHGFRERPHSGGSAETLRSYSFVLQVQNGPLSHRVHLGTGSITVKYVH